MARVTLSGQQTAERRHSAPTGGRSPLQARPADHRLQALQSAADNGARATLTGALLGAGQRSRHVRQLAALQNNASRASAQPKPVIQRYEEAGARRIAEDHTAAVGTAVNNKDFFATANRIHESNAELSRLEMPVSLQQGPVVDGIVGDQVLRRVTPKREGARVTIGSLPDPLTPRERPVDQQVLLPSECEKGAMAIIGALTRAQRTAGNAYVYHDKDHANARVGELLARSPATAGSKTAAYDRWTLLDEARDKAVYGYKNYQLPRADYVPMFAALGDNELQRSFLSNLELNPAGDTYVPQDAIFSNPRANAHTVFDRLIRAFDNKIAAVETAIMKTVDTDTGGERAELITASNLEQQLRDFFAAENYNKVAIDQAVAMVPDTAALTARLNQLMKQNVAGNSYERKSMFTRAATVRAMAADILEKVSQHVTHLTARNTMNVGGAGINKSINPAIGQSYGIVGGNYHMDRGQRWNFHWAAVIMKTGHDNVTMEAHASHKRGGETHNERWDFRMYGTRTAGGQTFHDEWKNRGFGQAPVTVLGIARANPVLHDRIIAYGINGLDAAGTDVAINAAWDLRNALNDIADPDTTLATINANNNAWFRSALTAKIVLPDNFVRTKINTDWREYRQQIAIAADLARAAPERNTAQTAARGAADNIRANAVTFVITARHYRANKRRLGIF